MLGQLSNKVIAGKQCRLYTRSRGGQPVRITLADRTVNPSHRPPLPLPPPDGYNRGMGQLSTIIDIILASVMGLVILRAWLSWWSEIGKQRWNNAAQSGGHHLNRGVILLIAAAACLVLGGVAFNIGLCRGEHGWDNNPVAPLIGLLPYIGILLMGLAAVLNLLAFIVALQRLITRKKRHWSLIVSLLGLFVTIRIAWTLIQL